jgi:hypothetical protein
MGIVHRIKQYVIGMGMMAMLGKGLFDLTLGIVSFKAGHPVFALGCMGGAMFWACALTATMLWRRRRAHGALTVQAATAQAS